MKYLQAKGEAFSPQKRTSSTSKLDNFPFFLFLWVIFALLDPDSSNQNQMRFRIHDSAKHKNIFRPQWKGITNKTCATMKTVHQNTANHRICPYMVTKQETCYSKRLTGLTTQKKGITMTYWASAQIQSPSEGLKSFDFLMSMLWKYRSAHDL